MSGMDDLYEKRLVLVMGKGGVGRTSVAAALAMNMAARGRKTLLYQAHASEKMGALLGGSPSSTAITRINDKLFTVNTTSSAALHEYGLMVLKFETVYRMVFENRVARSLIRAIPGLDEYAILGKLWFHTTETDRSGRPRWDNIVFDAPATGHAVSMLRIPRAIREAVPDGPLTRDAAKVEELLQDPRRTAVALVTLAEEMPATEASELYTQLTRELRMHVPVTIVNQLYPDLFDEGSPENAVLDAVTCSDDAGSSDDVLCQSLALASTVRNRRTLNEEHLERLAAELPMPQVRLPLLFSSGFGHQQVKELAAFLRPETAA